jgi:hypothetical protein
MKFTIRLFVPPILIILLKLFKNNVLEVQWKKIIRTNKLLKNIHQGERCFILCNGPSVKEQNLKYLKNEIVFSVSSGYMHAAYEEIKPRYHVVPQITFGLFTVSDAVSWFKEMNQSLKSEILFLSSQQYKLVEESLSLNDHNINYVLMNGEFDEDFSVPNIDQCIPGVQSVAIMAIMIAMYMGFDKIYLLGVDHDWFMKKNYSYAFGQTNFAGKDQGVQANGEMLDLLLADQLPIAATLWKQYRALHEIANKNDIKIYNATAGGALDEFERVDFEGIFQK